MSKQDRQGVRTAPDLERKYNLGQSLSGLEETRRIANSAKATADNAAMLASNAENEVRNLAEYVDNGLAGKVPAVESETYTGCYFRMVGEEAEWLNPPMIIGTEYRTTDRYNGKAVYIKKVDIGYLPNTTIKIIDGVVTGGCTGFVEVRCQRVYSGLSLIPGHDGTYGWLSITSNSDLSEYSEVVTLKYTKD